MSTPRRKLACRALWWLALACVGCTPSAQRFELTLAESENAVCDLGPSANCNL